MTRRPRTAATASALAAVLAAVLAGPAAAGPYRPGEYVTVQGRVIDRDGAPLAGVTVLLEPSRRVFKLSKLFQPKRNRQKTDRLQIPTETGADGRYSFEWRWDGYYDTFELAVAVPAMADGRKSYEILHRTDFTDRMKDGSPVEVTLEVEDPSRLSSSRSPSARRWTPPAGDPRAPAAEPRSPALAPEPVEAATDDERRILGEMGPPDRVDSFERLAGTETSWWYFEDGKVYHFLDGELSQVMHFDPIPPPEE